MFGGGGVDPALVIIFHHLFIIHSLSFIIYSSSVHYLFAQRDTLLHVFLRQPSQPEGASYPGIGFYVLSDEERELDLRKLHHESGFRSRQEVHAAVRLTSGKEYLLVPMTYKHKVIVKRP